jgi:protein-tyrosine-phosphatase
MDKTKVLFVCIHNSARRQMAEAFLGAFQTRPLLQDRMKKNWKRHEKPGIK